MHQIDQKKYLWLNILDDFIGDEITKTFYEQDLQNTKLVVLRIEEVLKKKSNNMYV